MWGWIRRQFDSVAGKIDNTVRNWVHDLINGVYGYLHNIFLIVGPAWGEVWSAVHDLYGAISDHAKQLFRTVNKLWGFWLPHIINTIKENASKLWGSISHVYHWAASQVDRAIRLAERGIIDVRKWALRDIWRPLTRDISKAWKWITGEGLTVWHYISHPDRLVDLIWSNLIAKLERDAWSVADKLGKFALALVTHNLRHFVALVEDILSAML